MNSDKITQAQVKKDDKGASLLSSETSTDSQSEVDSKQKQKSSIQTPASLRDKYTFIKEIGHGTQGRIYLAENNADHFQVAIKQLMIESVTNWKAYELFHREAEILSSLKIRGVARFYDAIECLEDKPPCSYIVQEYIPGQSLSDMLKAGHRFSLDRVYDIILQLLGIVGKLWLHNPPVIHRDIKPSNIILKPLSGDEYMVYLIDFGAVANPQVQGGGSTVAGTFGYMPPEQLMGKPAPQSDIYSLAAVAVHLITGISPADMPVKDFHLIFEPDMQNMPPALVQTLRGMLEPNVESRLCDMEELCQRFLNFSQAVYDSRLSGIEDTLSDEAYFEQLKKVQYYGQDGNIELWQRLVDRTPRFEPVEEDESDEDESSDKTNDSVESGQPDNNDNVDDVNDGNGANQSEENHKIDAVDENEETLKQKKNSTVETSGEAELSKISDDISSDFDFEKQFKILLSEIQPKLEQHDFFIFNEDEQVKPDLWNKFKNSYTFVIGVFLAVLVILFVLFNVNFVVPLILFVVSIGVVYVCHIKNIYVSRKEAEKKHGERNFVPFNYSIPGSETSDYGKDELWYLLKNGRKTIATIVGIEYKQLQDNNVESQFSIQKLMQHKECLFTCHGRPNFEIHYKFNPPDDMREEDLVHKIVVHTEPEGHYQVGDPLPILYMIMAANERYVKERVISMPFPFPADDPVLYTDIVYGDAFSIDYKTISSDDFEDDTGSIESDMIYNRRSKKENVHRNVYELLDYLKNAPRHHYDKDAFIGDDEQQNKDSDYGRYNGIKLTNLDDEI